MTEERHVFGEIKEVAGQSVVIAKPRGSPAGLTFLLTAANISLSKYISVRDALLKVDQVVVGFFINVLNPPLNNHRIKAEKVRDMWNELRKTYRINQYSIVGHSIGGKIALLVAAAYDDRGCVRSIVALDPVDQTPPEFTNADFTKNLNLSGVKASITMSYTDGIFPLKQHNARAINRKNPETKLVNHKNAGHMCYCDEETGFMALSWKSVMPKGSQERDNIAKREALELITEKTKTLSAGGLLKSAKKAVKSEVKSMNEEVKKVTTGALLKNTLMGGL